MKLNRLFKKSIGSKLFLMNLLMLVLIVISQLIFQAVYFEKYYIGQKKEKIDKSIYEFENLLKEDKSNDEIIEFIQSVKRKENIELSYEKGKNVIKLEPYMTETTLNIKGKNNKIYKIILGDQFNISDIRKGSKIKVVGIEGKYGYIFPRKIFINNVEVKPYYEIVVKESIESAKNILAAQVVPVEQMVEIQGQAQEIVNGDENLIVSNAELQLRENKEIRKNYEYSGKMKIDNSQNEVIYESKQFDNGYIIGITPIEQVNEVIGTMNNFYITIFLIAFILVVIISLIYSKILSKPLVEMKNMAKKISECDFREKYIVKREDEIGELGKSLNSISDNLEETLNELKIANGKLKEDVRVKKVQEDKRKELIGNISHELKTPITIIQGSINGIKSGMYSTEMYEDILEETNKMNDLVKEMLEVSKLESASFKLNEEAFDIYRIFLKEKDKLSVMIREKSLNMILEEVEDEEIIVFGDEKRINRVITNVLTNAIKYTPDGGDIKISFNLLDNKKYIFKVENFGVTLNEEELENIWDAFYRKEKSRNKKFGGTGLGLSIVKIILELHKSEFGIKSKENSVEFYFTLSLK